MSLWRWWTAVAGTVLVVGGVAWILKLWVIVATDGRVVATGAAGASSTSASTHSWSALPGWGFG
jgi:hypothetical protein